MGIHHHRHGYDLKPHPVMIVFMLSCLATGSGHRVTDFKIREGSMDCRVIAQLGDHLSGHRCQGWQVEASGVAGTPFRVSIPGVVREASHQDTVFPSGSHFMGISYTLAWKQHKNRRTASW